MCLSPCTPGIRFRIIWGTLSHPTVEAVITDVQIVGERAFHHEISFDYTLNDTTYSGESVVYVPGFGGKRKRLDVAEKEAAGFHIGDSFSLRYNPTDPNDVYIPETLTKPILQTGFGLFLVLTRAFFYRL